jgi:hypothetical protein
MFKVLLGEEPTEKSDVFSIGIIIWELFSGEELYATISPLAVGLGVIEGMRLAFFKKNIEITIENFRDEKKTKI